MADIFDRTNLDVFDEIELPTEEKVIYSDEMAELIREELRKEIAKIPIGKLITQVLERETAKQTKETDGIKGDLAKTKEQFKDKLTLAKQDIERTFETKFKELKARYDQLKTDFVNQPRYQFGGFSPQVNPLVIGPDVTEGSWRIVKSGTDLSFERYESGAWVQKRADTP